MLKTNLPSLPPFLPLISSSLFIQTLHFFPFPLTSIPLHSVIPIDTSFLSFSSYILIVRLESLVFSEVSQSVEEFKCIWLKSKSVCSQYVPQQIQRRKVRWENRQYRVLGKYRTKCVRERERERNRSQTFSFWRMLTFWLCEVTISS